MTTPARRLSSYSFATAACVAGVQLVSAATSEGTLDDGGHGVARFRDMQHAVDRLNGDIFWAPASGFTAENSWPNIFGDEARSVFGPIPSVSCADGMPLHAEVHGNRIEPERTPGGGVRYVHQGFDGREVDVTDELARCDKPSLANTDGHPCAVNSRLIRPRNPANDVEWVALCRKSELGSRLTGIDDYWHASNPGFALLGLIGFNRASGEVVFFDGSDFARGASRRTTFDGSRRYAPPGGKGYDDEAGRAVAASTWLYGRRVSCETCHDNKEPWIVTPHLKISRFGYDEAARDAAFGVDNPLPLVQPRSADSPYRVIGTRFTKLAVLSSRTFEDPSGNCTACHTLTTDWTGNVLAYDAVGRTNPAQPYRAFFDRLARFRTGFGAEEGGSRPWMAPGVGPGVGQGRHGKVDDADWARIADCINGTSQERCGYRPSYTACPAPESEATFCDTGTSPRVPCTGIGDPNGPRGLSVSVSHRAVEVDATGHSYRLAEIRWNYVNAFGDVPTRDDVRFNLAFRASDLPETSLEPIPAEFPDIEETYDPWPEQTPRPGGGHYCDFGSFRAKTCHRFEADSGLLILNNISYRGHVRNTAPTPTTKPRRYAVRLPVRCGKRYLARLVPKRFCFDRSGVVPGSIDHLAYFDVRCDDARQ